MASIHPHPVVRACGSRVLLVFRRREGGVEGGVRSVGAGTSGRRVGLLSVGCGWGIGDGWLFISGGGSGGGRGRARHVVGVVG